MIMCFEETVKSVDKAKTQDDKFIIENSYSKLKSKTQV